VTEAVTSFTEFQKLDLCSCEGGSRNFAGIFTISWVPVEKTSDLTVTITAGSDPLDARTFTPDNATQQYDVSDGTYKFTGTIIALYDYDGVHGQLHGLRLVFTQPNGPSGFTGTIGHW
jgi:hypothetical protein